MQCAPHLAQNTQLVDGIAAIVNDDIITITEVREAYAAGNRTIIAAVQSGSRFDQQVKASF
jgi:hypothetical protein